MMELQLDETFKLVELLMGDQKVVSVTESISQKIDEPKTHFINNLI